MSSTDYQALLKRTVVELRQLKAKLAEADRARHEPIAVIGMGCRFPGGADTPERYWNLLRNGVDAVTEVPRERWDVGEYFDSEPGTPGKMYTRRGAFVHDVDRFDAEFFGISAREAAYMDPQQRMLLEVSWEAIERAGYAPSSLSDSSTGVFVGVTMNDYGMSVLKERAVADIDLYHTSGTPLHTMAGRIAYVLGLRGPTMAIDTACSSSLVAVHLACQSLRLGESDLALAGGASLVLLPEINVLLCQARMLAPDGRCKTFDASADGYVRGEGCGVVLLKRLTEAVRDGDTIRAVIAGSAVSHGGASSGFTVPSGPAQHALVRRALDLSHVEPDAVDYVEAHGTGTSLGDPIEIGGLARVFGKKPTRERLLYVGSVKTNMGHLESAAGIAGLIKVVLSLEHGEIPRHLHFETPNPRIPWDELAFRVPTETTPWPENVAGRTAGVSSFGVSGVNAHAVLLEPPAPEPTGRDREHHVVERPIVLTLSAKSEPALREQAERFRAHLANAPGLHLPDVCHTANVGRSHFRHRLAVVGETTEDFVSRLSTYGSDETAAGVVTGEGSRESPKIAFLFSGQGSQYVGMGRDLYDTEPVFHRALDGCDELVRAHVGESLFSVLFSEVRDDASAMLHETKYTQPALFALEYSLAEMWRAWGIEPSILLGHSIGEYVAACVAGVLTLENAVHLVAERGRLMQALPRDGAMIAVRAGASIVEAEVSRVSELVAIAAVNGPDNVVLSGQRDALAEVVASLSKRGIEVKSLNVSHAFHSPLMEPMLQPFEDVVGSVSLAPPRIDIVSNVTGGIADRELTSASYWRRQIRETVQFADSMATLENLGYRTFLEVGPGTTLLSMGQACLSEVEASWLPSLRRNRSDWSQVSSSLSKLYVSGVEPKWERLHSGMTPRRVELPTYPFQRKRHWIGADTDRAPVVLEARSPSDDTEVMRSLENASTTKLAAELAELSSLENVDPAIIHDVLAELSRRHREEHFRRWVEESSYRVVWERKPRAETSAALANAPGGWLVLTDERGFGARVAEALESRGEHVVRMRASELTSPPWEARAYRERLATIAAPFRGIVHLWGLDTPEPTPGRDASGLESAMELGCGSLLGLVKALAGDGYNGARFWIVTRGGVTTGLDDLEMSLSQSPLWGLGKVIRLEHPELWGGLLDFDEGDAVAQAGRLLAEIEDSGGEDEILYRGGERYVARLAREVPAPPNRSSFRDDATYLITGGYGALGLEVARFLVDRGARHVALVGRHGASRQAARDRIRDLKRLGAEVIELKADVSSRAELERALEELHEKRPPLRGIVHAAGVLSDGILLHQSWDRFEDVLAPKVHGAWNLHALTRGLELDFFVAFSSMASLWGAPGQGAYASANAFLDALMLQRAARGLPGLSINWGPWSEVGMASSRALSDSFVRRGLVPVDPERGVEAFGRLVGRETPQVGVVTVRWPAFAKALGAVPVPPLFRAFIPNQNESAPVRRPDGAVASTPTGGGGAPDMPAAQRHAVIIERVKADVEQIMGGAALATDQPLNEVGLDSLMAVQISNRLAKTFGVDALTRTLLSGASIEHVADIVDRRLDSLRDATAPSIAAVDGMAPDEAKALLENIDRLSDDEVQLLLNAATDEHESGHEGST